MRIRVGGRFQRRRGYDASTRCDPFERVVIGLLAAFGRLTCDTHATMLTLVDELLAIDTIGRSPSPLAVAKRTLRGRQGLTDSVCGARLW
jgi:hypothetical protein